MNREQFWNLIESIDRAALTDGDDDAAVEPLEKMLRSLPVPDLESFHEHLSQCLYALDGEVFAREAGDNGHSDDPFLYARCYVVALGRKHYETTLKDPTLMPRSIDQWCEALLYPHLHAWSKLKGVDASEWNFEASVSYESGSNPNLWPS